MGLKRPCANGGVQLMKSKHMDGLYGRYTDVTGRAGATAAGRMKDRIRTVVILLLVAAVAVLGIVGGRAITYRQETHAALIGTLQTECNSALTLSNSLSRTAGSDSASILGRIRSHVHTADTINQLNLGLEGGNQYLVQPALFTSLYGVLDAYSDTLRTGMATGELQTELVAQLTNLTSLAAAIN